MSGAYSTANDVDVDLRRLFGSLARKWPRILLVSLLVTGAAFAFAWLSTPHYKAETRLLIETRESVFTRPDAGNAESDKSVARRGGGHLAGRGDRLDRHLEAGRAEARSVEAAGIRRGGRHVAVRPVPDRRRPEERSQRDPARRAGAEEVPREAQHLPGREVARHRDRDVVGEPGARGQDSEHHRRRLSGGAARRQAAVERRRDRLAGARDRRSVEAREGCRGARRRLPLAVGPADRAEQFGAGHAAAVGAVDRAVARARRPRRGGSDGPERSRRACTAAPRSTRSRKCCPPS